MQILAKKESKLLGRTEVEALFPAGAGGVKRKDAVKEIAQSMNVDEKRVALVRLHSQSGSRDLVGKFEVYESEARLKLLSPGYLSVRLLTKEEREAMKQAKKKAEQAAQQAKQQATSTKKK